MAWVCSWPGWSKATVRPSAMAPSQKGMRSSAAAGDPRGRDLLHSMEKSLSAEQIMRARQRASRLRQTEPQLSADMFVP